MPAFEEVPVLGAWITATACDFLLFLAYFVTLQRADWHEIGVGVVKRVNQIAGAKAQTDDEDEGIEMQRRLM